MGHDGIMGELDNNISDFFPLHEQNYDTEDNKKFHIKVHRPVRLYDKPRIALYIWTVLYEKD